MEHHIIRSLVLICLICNSTVVFGQEINQEKRYYIKSSKEELQDDIVFLKKCLEIFHPALYKYQSKSRFDSTITGIKNSLEDSLSQSQFQYHVAKSLASANCLHTHLALNKEFFDDIDFFGNYLPIKSVFIEGDDLYINQSVDSLLQLGDKLISINNISATNLLTKLYSCLSSDGHNQTLKTYSINNHFFYLFYTYILCSDNYSIKLLRNGKEIEVSIKGLKPKVFWSSYYNLYKIDNAPLIFSTIDSGRIGLIKLNAFSPNVYARYRMDYSKEFKKAFTYLRNNKVSNLIIDLRGCSGGAISVPMDFLTYLIDKPFRCIYTSHFKKDIPEGLKPHIKNENKIEASNFTKVDSFKLYSSTYDFTYKPRRKRFEGNVYFITDGGTLSSSGMFTEIVKDQKVGEIIGKETANGSYSGNNGIIIKLPNSGIYIEIANKVSSIYTRNTNGDGYGVSPDYPVETTINDLKQGKDVEITLIKELISKAYN